MLLQLEGDLQLLQNAMQCKSFLTVGCRVVFLLSSNWHGDNCLHTGTEFIFSYLLFGTDFFFGTRVS